MALGEAADSGRAGIGRRSGDPAGPTGAGIVRRESNRSGTSGPSGAPGGAGSGGSTPGPDGPGADTDRDDAHPPDLDHPNPYCAVTIVCGPRRLDLALPTAVRCSDLLPGLLRLLLPDEAPAAAHSWSLIPIGRGPLTGSETLIGAGVLAGDLLVLGQHPGLRHANSAVVMTRDRIEDVMNGQDRFWGPRTSRNLTRAAALLTGTLLLLPASNLFVGPASAAMSATVAVVSAMIAVLFHRRSEKVCAAAALTLGCLWAAIAGAAAVQSSAAAVPLVGAADGSAKLIMVAAGSALLLAGCTAVSYPSAIVHTTALSIVSIACAGLVVAIKTGAPFIDAVYVAALLAVLLMGGLPKVALAIGGLTGSDPSRESADLDRRIDRGDHVLIGCLIGVSMVAAGGVVPGALFGAGVPRVLAVGIGLILLLRSRAYSQTRHVLAPRVGGLLVFGIVWLGVYRDNTVLPTVLIVGAAAAIAAWAVVVDVLRRVPSPVGLARRARLFDIAEQLLVVALIVMIAWSVVLDEWVLSVIR